MKINISGRVAVHGSWTDIKAIALARGLRYREEQGYKRPMAIFPDGDFTYVSDILEGDAEDWATTKATLEEWAAPAQSGGFRSIASTVQGQVAAGATVTLWGEQGRKLAGLTVQVRDARRGDTFEVIIGVAAGTVRNPDYPGPGEPEFLPVGHELRTLGAMGAPQPRGVDSDGNARGWGERELAFEMAKGVPAHGKVGLRYTAVGGTRQRSVVVDFLRRV